MANDNNPGYSLGKKIGNFVRNKPRQTALVFFFVICFFGFLEYQDWIRKIEAAETTLAQNLGFDSREEWILMQSKGFKTKQEYLEAEAIKSGFESATQMDGFKEIGIKSGKQAKAKSISLGFNSLDEMLDAKKQGFSSKAELEAHNAAEKERLERFAAAEKERLERLEEEKAQASWQSNFFSLIKKYHKITNIFSAANFSSVMNPSRSDELTISDGKKMIKEAIGKEIRDIKCWYLGFQRVADEELWCYDRKFLTADFLFKVKITAAEARNIGKIYKNDEFLFSGNIYALDFTGVTYSRGEVQEQPVVVLVKATNIAYVRSSD